MALFAIGHLLKLFIIKMTKKYLFLIFISLVCLKTYSQSLIVTPSLGWGYGLHTKGSYNTVNDANVSVADYRSPVSFSNFLSNPQTGYFLEYRIDEHHQIGIGRMTGISEQSVKINYGNNMADYVYSKSIYRKLGVNYTYFLNKLSLQAGIFAVNNKIGTTPEGSDIPFTSATKDGLGMTIDSSFTEIGIQMRKWGMANSLGIGYSFINPKNNRVRFTLNLQLDISWFDLDGQKTFLLYDYDKSIASFSKTNGSQIKLFISKPILLYDVKKDRYNIFK